MMADRFRPILPFDFRDQMAAMVPTSAIAAPNSAMTWQSADAGEGIALPRTIPPLAIQSGVKSPS